ncbi:MAG TPA: hypothetical protein VGI41_05145, partial [Candidatus Udaeobacter sp.]
MNKSANSEENKFDRRYFFGAAVMSVAAAQLGIMGSARAESKKTGSPEKNRAANNTSFASIKQIDAGLLNVGYAEAGPANGPVVLLLHGWPYDIYSFV